MPLKKIFFSYSRQDGSDFSLRLATDLKRLGFNVWIDQQDIRAGTEWDIEVEKALETCDCLLFIETEKSVLSNNVLDEVYYALGQNKKVIPLIVVDSKTPFRIQRIQHIDFTKDYDNGLKKLIQELQSEETGVFADTPQTIAPRKTFMQHYAGWLLAAAAVIVIIVSAFWFNASNRKALADDSGNISEEKTLQEETEPVADSVIAISAPSTTRAAKKIIPAEDNNRKPITGNTSNKFSVKTSDIDFNALEGQWQLKSLDFKAGSSDGYLKIESVGDKKFNIRSTLRFFYLKPTDTAYLSIFNAFAGCKSCPLKQEIKLEVEDIALGSQVYSILKHDQEGVGKAGDTIMDRGSNKSIRGTAELQFMDNTTALIKIARTTPVELEGGLVVKPFEYLFTFKKME